MSGQVKNEIYYYFILNGRVFFILLAVKSYVIRRQFQVLDSSARASGQSIHSLKEPTLKGLTLFFSNVYIS